MKYSIIKVINGNYFIHAEGIVELPSAKISFHNLCASLWNEPSVISATVKIMDEQLDNVDDYREFITHPVVETNQE